uniref:hypothetical protein n=1 Tax=Agathobacter sp. TaxID=2021311 RepID=UPI004057BE32
MIESINNIKYWFLLYYADGIFLLMAIVACLYLFVCRKDIRVKLLYPVALIAFCLVNPILYKFVYSRTIYWRLFWMIPNAIIIALAITVFIRRRNKNWQKFFVLLLMVLMIVNTGTNAFVHGGFVKVENWEKLPASTLSVCDTIREIDATPRALFPKSLYSYVRQYAPDIEMAYGRNADLHIGWCGMECMLTFWHMENEVPNYDFIFRQAVAFSCDIVVLEEHKPIEISIPIQYGYAEAARTDGYVIYYNEEINAIRQM